MPNTSRSLIDTKTLMIPVALAVLLVFISQFSFLLFHVLAESFAILVAVLATVVAWQMYDFTRNHFLMYLGCGYFSIAVLDLLHTLTYSGMSVFPIKDADVAVQFWIGTRYLEAVLLLSSPWFLSHALKRNIAFTIFAVAAVILTTIIMSGNFPVAYIEGEGLTKFKIYSEYIIICIIALGMFYLTRQRQLIDQRVFKLMIIAMTLTMLAELAFTFYVSVYGLSNLAGHIFKLFSFWLIFVAVVRTTLREPFSALSKAETYYDAVPDATIIIDDEGVIQHVNKAASLMADKTTVQLIGKHSHDVFHNSSVMQKNCPLCQEISSGNELSAYELKVNEEFWCDFSTSTIHDQNGTIVVIRNITDKNKTNIALKNSESLLSTLFETLPELIWLKDPEGVYLACNLKFERLFGAKEEEIIGKTDYDFVDKELADYFRKNDKIAMAAGKSSTNEEEITYADDGHKELVETIKTPMLSANGELIGVLGVARDITERKHTDEIMQNIATGVSAQIGEAFFESLTIYLAKIFDVEYAIIGLLDEHDENRVNTLALCVDGEIADNLSYELEGTPCRHIVDDTCDKTRSYSCDIQKLYPDDQMLVDMRAESYVGVPLVDVTGKRIGLIVVLGKKKMENTRQVENILQIFAVRTIAEIQRLNNEQTLAKSSKEWSFAMDFFEDAIYLIDMDDKLVRANRVFYQMTGMTPELAVGKDITTIIHPDGEEVPCPVCKARKERRDEVIIMEADHPDNPAGKPIQITVQIIRDKKGAPLSVLMGIRDLTNMRAAEDENSQLQHQLHQAQKMDALGKLTGGIAHDYNNMLGVVMGYAELLNDSLKEQPKLSRYADEIYRAGERGAKLTTKLLSFSRHRVSEASHINLNALLKTQQHMLEKTLTVRIKLILDLAENIWGVWINDSEMEDVILNISINAMHAIEGNGQLTIKTSNEHLDQRDASVLGIASGNYVLLSITDTGCGMDEEIREKIFEPFFSTKGEKGTGLGLSQAYGFVHSSGGAIKVYSEPTHGTRFSLYFPRHRETEDKDQLIEKDNSVDIVGTETILLVDDETALLDLNCEILSQQGFNVITAESAKQALEILKCETVDLLLSDIIMPEMDGYQLAATVKENYPDVKIQLASGFADDRNMSMVDEKLQQNLLFKPFNSQTLLKRIHELLNN